MTPSDSPPEWWLIYKNKRGEARLQAELYRHLVNAGVSVLVECRIPIPGQFAWVRADLAIVACQRIVLLIEVKRMPRPRRQRVRQRQYQQYKATGKPFVYVTPATNLPKLCQKIVRYVHRKSSNGGKHS